MADYDIYTLKIDENFKNLIPPLLPALLPEERKQLEENIINDGCREPFCVWNKTILDGHNRYEICTRLQIPFKISCIFLPSREEAVAWICANQLKVFVLAEHVDCFVGDDRAGQEQPVVRRRIDPVHCFGCGYVVGFDFVFLVGDHQIGLPCHDFFFQPPCRLVIDHRYLQTASAQRTERLRFFSAGAIQHDEVIRECGELCEFLIKDIETKLGKLPKPQTLAPPEKPEENERVYISALLDAYDDASDADNPPSEDLSQHPKFEKDLKQRRIEYFAAEAVRRGTRENFRNNDPDNMFTALLDETYNGVVDVHALEYKHGFERLLKVLAHATTLQLQPLTRLWYTRRI